MTASNISGIVVAVIVFSGYKVKDFLKPVYYICVGVSVILIPICDVFALTFIPYKGQVISASLNIFLYAILAIRIISDIRCKIKRTYIYILIGWLLMLVLMLTSVNENIWPLWFIFVYGTYYVSDFGSDRELLIYHSIIDGIIIAFFLIQGLALLFRPYDRVRYVGLYINPNINALFYLTSYAAFLCKWFEMKKAGNHTLAKAFFALFAGLLYGFTAFTGSKASVFSMIFVTIPFIFLSLKYESNKLLSFFKHWVMLGIIGILSIPIIYYSIRYIPTIHLHPLYFEGEYNEYKIQPGDPNDSEKYISFEKALNFNLGRVFYKISDISYNIKEYGVLHVYAAESEFNEELEFAFTDEEYKAGVDPLRLRLEIYKYYFNNLNYYGHKNSYDGAPIYSDYIAPHAHNVFLQFAFLYGIPSGLLFALMVFLYIPGCINLFKLGEDFRVCVISCFAMAFVLFGLFEIDWMCGQLPFTLFFLLFRDIVRRPCPKLEIND